MRMQPADVFCCTAACIEATRQLEGVLVLQLCVQSYDATFSLAAIAPRPFLIANGELDPRCPIAGLEMPIMAAQQAYKAMGHPENLKVHFEKALAHAPSTGLDNAVNEWLDLHLLSARRP